jgi:hypothetical protein
MNYLNCQYALNKKKGIICLDGTYKITNLNYPMLVFTTPDPNHHSFSVAFAISSGESQVCYTFFLKSINHTYKLIYGSTYTPTFVISDCSDAIINSSKEVYSNITNIHCYFHNKFFLKDNFAKNDIKDKKLKSEILEDIDIIRTAHSEYTFENAFQLFKKKYKSYAKFLKYLESTYIDR